MTYAHSLWLRGWSLTLSVLNFSRLFFNKLSPGKTFTCKVLRLNVKQRRSRWDGSLWAVSSGSMLFAKKKTKNKTKKTNYYYRLWQWKSSTTLRRAKPRPDLRKQFTWQIVGIFLNWHLNSHPPHKKKKKYIQIVARRHFVWNVKQVFWEKCKNIANVFCWRFYPAC